MQKEPNVCVSTALKFSDSSECRDCETEKRGGGPVPLPLNSKELERLAFQ